MVAAPLLVSPYEFFATHSQTNGETKNCSKYESEISAIASKVRTPLCGLTWSSLFVGGVILESFKHRTTSCWYNNIMNDTHEKKWHKSTEKSYREFHMSSTQRRNEKSRRRSNNYFICCFFSLALFFHQSNTLLHFCLECDKEMNELETMKATMTNYEKLKNELLFGQMIKTADISCLFLLLWSFTLSLRH